LPPDYEDKWTVEELENKEDGSKRLPTFVYNTVWNRRHWKSVWLELRSCYRTDYDINTPTKTMKMMTLASDLKNIAAWHVRKDRSLTMADFTTLTEYANQMDVCTKFLDVTRADGWSKVDADRIAKVRTEEFRAGLQGNARPVDSLKTMGLTFLHEVSSPPIKFHICSILMLTVGQFTHTHQGGLLGDNIKEGIPDCYGWYCITQLHDVRNSGELSTKAIFP
jgi:hypothetical protein